MEPVDCCVAGISGGTCSGKTTLAQKIAAHFGPRCVVVSQDWYYRDLSALPVAARAQVNFDDPASVETALLREQVAALAAGRAVDAPQYDFARHTRRAGTLPLSPAPVLVVEGLHVIGMAALSDLLTLRVFVEASDAERLARRLARDTRERGRTEAQVISQFETTVRPMHTRFVAPLSDTADFVVDGGMPLDTAVSVLAARIERRLRAEG